ncbi:hypothetical protein KA013_00910 [Patescibacteria group bacterium]|nr:hypothetical protein [Patescibacteria group bacterium]
MVDLIQKGEVPILAERIKTFILGRYTQGTPTYFMNGQSDIAKYLTDMYAK